MKGAFITATGTEIGKTYFTCQWVRALRQKQMPALGLKPIICGERTDAELIAKANEETLSLNEINPIWLQPPVSPLAACAIEDRPFDFSTLRDAVKNIYKKHSGPLLVEGVGGWLVPIVEDYYVRDWAQELQLPIVVVINAGLGTLNHTLLTVESIRQAQLDIIGIIMNFHNCPKDLATQTNPAILEQIT
ncbi:MAG: dethiobiotin synthase, partial [Verrucomicrobiota bacterium]